MTNRACDTLLVNAQVATMTPNDVAYGLVENAALAIRGTEITWLGPLSELPSDMDPVAVTVDLEGKLVTPGLIDCHTHLVYAANRAGEFEMALGGASYEEIANKGGGIVSTVAATRAASADDLLAQSLPRLQAMAAQGVTTVEIKSGYGLDQPSEIKMLDVADRLGNRPDIQVHKTFLGAHATPVEFSGRKDDYIDAVCRNFLPAAHEKGLVDAVDGFCEGIGFSAAQIQRVFETAKGLGLPVKLHAEQLSDLGGAQLAAKYGALSADHLEYVSEQGVTAMARSGTVAVLLPGAFYFLRETKMPPVDLFRRNGVPIALGTDCNPGSSPTCSPLLMMNMACILFRMTPEEALQGFTLNGARALGISEQTGTIAVGKQADLAIWNCQSPAELAYSIGYNPLHARYKAGRLYAAGMHPA